MGNYELAKQVLILSFFDKIAIMFIIIKSLLVNLNFQKIIIEIRTYIIVYYYCNFKIHMSEERGV